MNMRNFDEKKLARLHTASELLDQQYGKEGTPSRTAFEEKAKAYYYGVILRNQRKREDMS